MSGCGQAIMVLVKIAEFDFRFSQNCDGASECIASWKTEKPSFCGIEFNSQCLTHEKLFYFTYPDYLENICYTEGPVRLLRNHLHQSVFDFSRNGREDLFHIYLEVVYISWFVVNTIDSSLEILPFAFFDFCPWMQFIGPTSWQGTLVMFTQNTFSTTVYLLRFCWVAGWHRDGKNSVT